MLSLDELWKISQKAEWELPLSRTRFEQYYSLPNNSLIYPRSRAAGSYELPGISKDQSGI